MDPAGALDVVAYYHEPCKAPLLLAGVLPAASAAERRGLHAHVERHWLHGPHLRIRLGGTSGLVAETAERTRADLQAAVAAHPSRAGLTPAQLLAQAEVNGRAELVQGPYQPIHPDNTVRIEPADDTELARLLGSTAAVGCRHQLMRLGLDAVRESAKGIVRDGNAPTARVRVALTAMAAHAGAYPLGLSAGYVTFLSHVEDFLFRLDPAATLRARFDSTWLAQADRVTAIVERVAAGEAGDALAAAWAGWVRAAWQVCAPAYDRGELPLHPGPEYARRARSFDAATAARWEGRRDVEYSEFHRMLMRFDFVRGIEREFGPYRFATNVLYQLLLVCDVTPVERYLAAYLISQATQRITGRSWRDDISAHLDRVQASAAGRQP